MATRKKSAEIRPTRLQNRYFDRDESWLAFNGRVLEEAQDNSNPLLERVKFLAITASNLDEFFEIRLASIMQRLEEGYDERGPDGHTLAETLDRLKRPASTIS
jgi:polyphosphate kinase